MKTPQEFINGILAEFIDINEDSNEMFLWKNKAIIDVMDFAEKIQSRELIQEGLLIIMQLYNGFLKISEIEPSNEIISLPPAEKAEFLSIISQEFS